MARPGIMIYFEILAAIKVLPLEDIGRLLIAMLEYGQEGIDPHFDGMLALAWGFVKPKLDKDKEEYNRTVLKRQYATFCRDRKKRGEPEIEFDDWLKIIDDHPTPMVNDDAETDHMIPHDTTWYPTTTTTTTTITTTAAATTTTDGDGGDTETDKVKCVGGELGQGVVVLSDAQISDLLDKMGVDVFNHYMAQLSSFIIKNNAKVGNHYETLLIWWKEDSAVKR